MGNRRLRRTLYRPALVAVQHDPHLRASYQRRCAKGKAPLQALATVMRKLLHAFHAMLRLDQPYDGSRLCPDLTRSQLSHEAQKEKGSRTPPQRKNMIEIEERIFSQVTRLLAITCENFHSSL